MLQQHVDDIHPVIVETIDRFVIATITEPNNTVINQCKAIVRAEDGKVYTAHYTSTYTNGTCQRTPYTGFEALNDDATPSPDEER